MKAGLILFSIMIVMAFKSSSQENSSLQGAEACSVFKSQFSKMSSVYLRKDIGNHTYDVLKYTINLDIYNCFIAPFPYSFNGDVSVKFKVRDTISSVNLNAVNTSIQIDSVRLAGIGYNHSNNMLSITLNKTYQSGDSAEFRVYYKHKNVKDFSFYAKDGMIFTDCEPEGARNWFPCWDKPSDKATTELIARVPNNVILGSNGKLKEVKNFNGAKYYHWVSKDPVSTYLVSMAGKVNYNLDIVNWQKPSNPSDTVPIWFLYNQGEDPTVIEGLINQMTSFYSQKFCEHPFEKNGFASLNSDFSWGGMENQTLTHLCQNCWREDLIAHEFAHQWFGDMITCGTWADIWLNEGFATYVEALWQENRSGYSAYKSVIVKAANDYLLKNPGWPISNPSWSSSTPDVNVLFNFQITYEKGACVLHLLRYTLGDELFFKVLKNYASDPSLQYKNAVITDFIKKVNETTGTDMSWFFNEWLYQPNHPVYNNSYKIFDEVNGSWQVNFVARQIQTSPAFFTMPIELKISFNDQTDSTLRIFNDQNNQQFSFLFKKRPVAFYFDPNNQLVLKSGITVGTNDNINTTQNVLYQNFPNPARSQTTISFNLIKQVRIRLFIIDQNGRERSKLIDEMMGQGYHFYTLNTSEFQTGMYTLCLDASDGKLRTKQMMIIK